MNSDTSWLTYTHKLWVNIGCNLEDQPGAMVNRDGWQVRVKELSYQHSLMTVIIIGFHLKNKGSKCVIRKDLVQIFRKLYFISHY